MAATISSKERNKLPDWAISTASQIEDLGFSNWVFDWEYPVPALEDTKRVQIRDEGHVGQRQEVNLYAEGMKRGDKFPPGVISRDGFVVDFNTRQRAALKLQWPTFPMFIIQEDYANAKPFLVAQFHMLGAAFNTGGPKPLTRKEISDNVRKAAATGNWDTNKVARDLNITRNAVANIFAQFRAEKRAELLGVSFNGSVNDTVRTMLGQSSEKLADDPYREIAKLVQDAGMISADVGALLRAVAAITTGDADRLALIYTEREAREQQIAGFRASGKRKPPLSSKVRTCAEFLAGHEGPVDELVDVNPNTRGEFLTLIEQAEVVLAQLVEAQQRANQLVEVS